MNNWKADASELRLKIEEYVVDQQYSISYFFVTLGGFTVLLLCSICSIWASYFLIITPRRRPKEMDKIERLRAIYEKPTYTIPIAYSFMFHDPPPQMPLEIQPDPSYTNPFCQVEKPPQLAEDLAREKKILEKEMKKFNDALQQRLHTSKKPVFPLLFKK
ncbi:unnamed protein product [Bursaphelenchus okinawaensis]|uniref:Uncharacterized protein n=1 Tax=Bursaphelenchus okinawaensis TaxID=465554 RepID=A0A811KQ40_9BILA|nr:unnamed protein product [Bursaphelenchus okinawaensis]CAG9107261.1 unnamed protein product [Bursaphelenchus okinawaensis]